MQSTSNLVASQQKIKYLAVQNYSLKLNLKLKVSSLTLSFESLLIRCSILDPALPKSINLKLTMTTSCIATDVPGDGGRGSSLHHEIGK